MWMLTVVLAPLSALSRWGLFHSPVPENLNSSALADPRGCHLSAAELRVLEVDRGEER